VTTTAITHPMTADEARLCIADIKTHIGKRDEHHELARQRAYELGEREGFKALGYESYLQCVKAEFGNTSFQHVYRLRAVVRTEHELQKVSPTGEKFQLPETHNRILNSLPTPEHKYRALKKAEAIAQAEGSEVVSERHLQRAVRTTAMEMRVATIPLLSHLVNSGSMGVEDADNIGARLDSFKPATKGYLFQHIAAAGGISDPQVVSFIGQQYERRAEDKVAALVINTLDASGCLGGVALRSANMTNALRELSEARDEVESDEKHTADDYGPVNLTVWERDVDGSAAAIATIIDKRWAILLHQRLGEVLGVKTV
jgi:hypothetical protein